MSTPFPWIPIMIFTHLYVASKAENLGWNRGFESGKKHEKDRLKTKTKHSEKQEDECVRCLS